MPETMIKLFCWIFGDEKSFPVKISPDETVGDLKEAIVAKKPNRLQGIDADSLRLWKKEISDEEKDGLQLSDLNVNDELNEMHKVGYYFGYTPPEMKIHIVVRTPESTGEISSSSYLHRLHFPSLMSCPLI
jgi:Crinkler effector protein N-terminal domain